MNGEILIIERPDYISFEQITELLHNSFAYWLKNGIAFIAATQTVDITKQPIGDGKCFVCLINDSLIGTVTISENSHGIKFEQLAVSPEYQNKGIATKLINYIENYAYSKNKKYIQGDTRLNAKWLLNWYLNKLEYRKYLIIYNNSQKCYSVFFRKYLHRNFFTDIYCSMHYIMSPIFEVIRIFKKVIRKIRKLLQL